MKLLPTDLRLSSILPPAQCDGYQLILTLVLGSGLTFPAMTPKDYPTVYSALAEPHPDTESGLGPQRK